MRLYKVKSGIIIENKENYFLVNNMSWDDFFNDDKLLDKMKGIADSQNPISNGKDIIKSELQAPIQSQEIWAAGVTYFNSKLGRQEEANSDVVPLRGGYRPKRLKSKQLYILQGLPQIGPELARRLLRQFGTVSNVMNATIFELMAVEGIGRVSAERIRETLDAELF